MPRERGAITGTVKSTISTMLTCLVRYSLVLGNLVISRRPTFLTRLRFNYIMTTSEIQHSGQFLEAKSRRRVSDLWHSTLVNEKSRVSAIAQKPVKCGF
jgi:hypothetical protein